MKKIHRFLQTDKKDYGTSVITETRIVHQIAHVLQLKEGEQIQLFYDREEERTVTITKLSKKEIHYSAYSSRTIPPPSRNVIAALALTKHDSFELAVQKLSELGIAEIIPLITKRTIKKDVRLERLQRISDEAVELSGSVQRVQIHPPTTIETLLSTTTLPIIVCDINGSTTMPSSQKSLLYICGPEGGLTEDERVLLTERGATGLRLAPTTLRAETAGILAGYLLIWH